LVDKYVNSDWKDEYLSLLQVSQSSSPNEHGMHSDAKLEDGPLLDSFLELATRVRASAKAKSQSEGDPAPSTGTDQGTDAGTNPGAGGGSEASLVGACEVCVFVIENKEQHQPYLCRGLKDPNYQKACVETMESLMWWITNEVYWLNYGCQREMNGAVEWVRPCPAHAVCSWIEQLYTRTPFCPADPYYKKPQ